MLAGARRRTTAPSDFPAVFPVDATGAPANDHLTTLLDMFFDTRLVSHNATGPVSAPEARAFSALAATPRPMPEPRTLSEDELRAIQED